MLDAFRVWVRETWASRYRQDRPPEDIEIGLRIRLRPRDGWAAGFEPGLETQVVPQLEQAEATVAAFLPGAVFSFRDDSAQAPECRPARPDHVFAGFDSVGRPTWTSFAQALMDAGDDRIDRLYARPLVPLARVRLGKELKADQLASFGRSSRAYNVLGQVAAGLFQPRAGPPFAITVQVVEAWSPRPDAPRLRVNLLCGWEGFVEWRGCEDGAAVGRAVRSLEGRVEALDRTLREGGPDRWDRLRKVPGLMRDLAQSLERGGRQVSRRTGHARRRRDAGRPVAQALADVRGAPDDAFHEDRKAGTWVVTGPAGRTHVFSGEGRLVTSLRLTPAATEARRRRDRWVRIGPAEVAGARDRILAYGAGDGGGPASANTAISSSRSTSVRKGKPEA